MDSITTIKDSRVKVKASRALTDFLENHNSHLKEVPESVHKILYTQSIYPPNVKIITENQFKKSQDINIKDLRELLKLKVPKTSSKNEENKEERNSRYIRNDLHLYLNDLHWLNNFLTKLREEEGVDIYLNDILDTCHLEMPQNEVIKRNPELEARCQKLREEQQNLEYRKMTKNVDSILKHYPEDTIAYQIKAINSQIIAVLQFILSVVAGFAFGFLGINLIIGNIEFGLRLLLGIMCALIIALAEIYFLAKKLNEYDCTLDTTKKALKNTLSSSKIHAD